MYGSSLAQRPQEAQGARETVTLFVLQTPRGLARWRTRREHDPILSGSVSTKGYGTLLAFPTPTDASALIIRRLRALSGSSIVPMTTGDLKAFRHHAIVLCECGDELRLSGIATSHAATYLALTPEQRRGAEGNAIRAGRLPR